MKKSYVRRKRGIMMLLFLISVQVFTFAQSIKVTGTVSDPTGAPLPGVNISAIGKGTGAITNLEGIYTIDVPSDAKLEFSFIGFATKVVDVNNQTVIDITLVEDATQVGEVVVVGYGTVKKSDVTGAITSVNTERLRDVPASNITKALQGKTAGVEIQNIGSRPGAGSQIRIRGNRSLGASNDPLIVLDGIPFTGSMSDIASDDIASIEVLKDASATVIYGSRGSNGVVIITTKRGKQGGLKVTYNGYYGLNTVARKYELYNAEEFVNLRTVANYTNYMPVEKESMLLGRETDWQDLIYQTGTTTNHEINLSGGSEKTQYSFSGGYFNETGVIPATSYGRYNIKMSIDQKIGKRVKLGLTSMNSMALTSGGSAGFMWPMVSLTPLMPPYNADGTLLKQPAWDTDKTYNPLTFLDENSWNEKNRRFASFNTLYLEVDIFEGFKYRANVGLDLSYNKYNNYYGSETEFRQGSASTARVSNTDNTSYTIENMLIYEKTFGIHRIGVTAMQSVQEYVGTNSTLDGTNMPADYLQFNNISLAETVQAPTNSGNYYSRWGLLSFMGRVNYSLLDRYLITVTGRTDASSRLAEGKKWNSYPAIALAWKISEESFLKNNSVVSNLKLRFGYGETANTSFNPYTTLGGLSSAVYSFGSTGVKGNFVSTLPNPNLEWETTGSTNLAVDFGLFDGRINGSVDVYQQKTDGVLLDVALPPSQGVPGSYKKNVGSTENKGIEIVLNGMAFNSPDPKGFTWEINTNVFFNREEITSLQDTSVKQDIGNGWFVGQPASAIYDYEKIGIWQLGEESDAAIFGAKPGDIKLKDLNGDNKIDDKDRKVLGSSQPKLMGGFTSTWAYKGFDLSVVGYFRIGGMIASTLHMPNNYINRLDGRRNGIKVDYWTPNNPTNDMPKPDYAINASRSNVLGYFDGSFLKIRSINLGYNLDTKGLTWLGADTKVRLYVNVTDPFIFFSPYIEKGGVDPEPTNNASSDNSALSMPGRTLVVGLGNPPVRKYIFGINVKF